MLWGNDGRGGLRSGTVGLGISMHISRQEEEKKTCDKDVYLVIADAK